MSLAGLSEEQLAEAIVQAIKTATAPLVRRIEILEQPKDLGLFKNLTPGQPIQRDATVTDDGSLFICTKAHAHVAGREMDHTVWRLAVKRGRDGRNAAGREATR